MKTKFSILVICFLFGLFNSCGGGGGSNEEITPQCGNGITETGEECDGETTCSTSCTLLSTTTPPESNCSDGLDDDSDGVIDCADTDCSTDAACDDEGGEAACTGDGCDSASASASDSASASPAEETASSGFSGDGIYELHISGEAAAAKKAKAIAIQDDGKIIAVGSWNLQPIIIRLSAEGILEKNLGTVGPSVGPLQGPSHKEGNFIDPLACVDTVNQINAVAVQNDGKIIVAGTDDKYDTTDGHIFSITICRYNKLGTLDRSFANSGSKIIVNKELFGESHEFVVKDVVSQSDGKMIIVGNDGHDFFVLRLTSNGEIDTSFGGGDGWVGPRVLNTAFSQYVLSVALQTDGKIVTVGGGEWVSSSYADYASIMRLNEDGTLDPSFDRDGVSVLFDFSSRAPSGKQRPIIQDDGKIIVAGDSCLFKLNSDGSLDETFANNGFLDITPSFDIEQIVPLDKKILAVGAVHVLYGDGSSNEFAGLTLFNSDGEVDTTFGSDGTGRVSISFGDEYDGYNSFKDAVVQNDGKIVAVEYSIEEFTGPADYPSDYDYVESGFFIVRLNPDGSLDAAQ